MIIFICSIFILILLHLCGKEILEIIFDVSSDKAERLIEYTFKFCLVLLILGLFLISFYLDIWFIMKMINSGKKELSYVVAFVGVIFFYMLSVMFKNIFEPLQILKALMIFLKEKFKLNSNKRKQFND